MKNNMQQMMCLDIVLSSMTDDEYEKIKHFISPSQIKAMPLASWDIFSTHYFKTLEILKTQNDINAIKAFAKKAKWENNLDILFEDQYFEALVITNTEQKILWVNDGFTEMTGYSKRFALNKTPNFLQGRNTLQTTRKSIRKKLDDLKPFTEIITNYKKDNSPYKCEVQIIPMYSDRVTHFLAIEKQVV